MEGCRSNRTPKLNFRDVNRFCAKALAGLEFKERCHLFLLALIQATNHGRWAQVNKHHLNVIYQFLVLLYQMPSLVSQKIVQEGGWRWSESCLSVLQVLVVTNKVRELCIDPSGRNQFSSLIFDQGCNWWANVLNQF